MSTIYTTNIPTINWPNTNTYVMPYVTTAPQYITSTYTTSTLTPGIIGTLADNYPGLSKKLLKKFGKYNITAKSLYNIEIQTSGKAKWDNFALNIKKYSIDHSYNIDSYMVLELTQTIKDGNFTVKISNNEIIIGKIYWANEDLNNKMSCAPFLQWLYSVGARKLERDILLKIINLCESIKIPLSNIENAPNLLKETILFL